MLDVFKIVWPDEDPSVIKTSSLLEFYDYLTALHLYDVLITGLCVHSFWRIVPMVDSQWHVWMLTNVTMCQVSFQIIVELINSQVKIMHIYTMLLCYYTKAKLVIKIITLMPQQSVWWTHWGKETNSTSWTEFGSDFPFYSHCFWDSGTFLFLSGGSNKTHTTSSSLRRG